MRVLSALSEGLNEQEVWHHLDMRKQCYQLFRLVLILLWLVYYFDYKLSELEWIVVVFV